MDYQNDEAQQNDYKAKRGSNKIAPADGTATPVEFGDAAKALEVEKAAEAKAAEANNGERDAWGGKLDFFLSALSFSVGLGAVWRFPYLCYKNGGGAFLIPFIIFLFILGIPLMYMELAIGQFASRGPIKAWVMSSVSRGIGISTSIINNYLSLYYIMIIGYSFYYLVLSLTDVLPWETCGDWAGLNCVDNFNETAFKYTLCEDKNDTYKYLKCVDDGQCYLNTSTILDPVDCNTNKSFLIKEGWWNPAYPSQDYWNKVVLNKSSNIDDFSGGLVWQLVVALFFAWFVTFFCVFRGVKVSGKIVYFTALFPYLVLMILGVNGWMLEGAGEGISYYILPKPEKLADVNVWKDAAVQVFFSLSLSYGGLIALSSYNPHNNNCLRDAFFLTISNFLTCIFAGFVVFAYMGALAHETHLPVDKVVQGGQGLVYIVYPFAVTTLPVSPLWSVMFFVMMLALGMGTIMAAVQTLMTSLEDFFPIVSKTAWHKAATLGVICVTFFTIGLLFTSSAGSYWIEFFDTYSANWGIFIVALFQCVCVAWVYGIKRFRYDIRSMIPETSPRLRRISDYAFYLWIASWQFIIPIMLVTLTIFAWIGTKPLELDGVVFPQWSVVVGNLITCTTLFGVFGWLGYEMFKVVRGEKTLREVLEPLPTWRPSSDANYEKWRDGKVYAELSEYPYPRKDEESAL